MIFIFLGAPGAGKGTQADMAASSQGWIHLSTGDVLREEVAKESDLGQAANEYMSRGDLVPDRLMVDMVAGRLAELNVDDVLLLDGFPRSRPQAEALAEALKTRAGGSGGVGSALYFRAPESVLTARLLGRGRKDDREDVIQNRLRVYSETTEPLVAYYREQGLLVEIDADRTVEEIQADVLDRIGAVLPH
ncbi:MAG: adenylate kinase [Planctomycetota bacterium]|nr:MAG: adenylate kinase [Planctomycetota bacterium]